MRLCSEILCVPCRSESINCKHFCGFVCQTDGKSGVFTLHKENLSLLVNAEFTL